MKEPVDTILSEWAAAERAGDTEKLTALLTADFYGVGPLGFVLPRSDWVGRHGQGLTYEAFDLDEIEVHFHGEVAIVTARNTTRGTYHGQPLPEALRTTLVTVTDSGARRVAAIHMSFIASTLGGAPIPGAATLPQSSERPGPDESQDFTNLDPGDRQ